DFHRQLGVEVGGTHTPEGLSAPVWAWLRRGGTHMMINRAEAPITATHASASVWVYTKDVQSAHAALRSRGLDVGTIDHPPYNPRGEFHVHDPDVYAIFIAHAAYIRGCRSSLLVSSRSGGWSRPDASTSQARR